MRAAWVQCAVASTAARTKSADAVITVLQQAVAAARGASQASSGQGEVGNEARQEVVPPETGGSAPVNVAKGSERVGLADTLAQGGTEMRGHSEGQQAQDVASQPVGHPAKEEGGADMAAGEGKKEYAEEESTALDVWLAAVRAGHLKLGDKAPSSWHEGVHYSRAASNTFRKGEIVVSVRSNGDRTIATVEKVKNRSALELVVGEGLHKTCSVSSVGKIASVAR